MLKFENRFKQKFPILIGIDEAGRAPLAGPVVAAAVHLKSLRFRSKIRDSKQMSAGQRDQAFHEILDQAYVGVGIMNESIIDTHNILQATFMAMNYAVGQLVRRLPKKISGQRSFVKKTCLLVDGHLFKTEHPFQYKTIVRGDSQSLSIACASIVAKVTRDRILKVYHRIFPQYGFDQHKGYPTLRHKEAIRKYGPSLIHRRSFHGVA